MDLRKNIVTMKFNKIKNHYKLNDIKIMHKINKRYNIIQKVKYRFERSLFSTI